MRIIAILLMTFYYTVISAQINYETFPKKRIMILGLFHFISNNDIIKTEKINMQAENKQKEIAEINRQLSKFNPNKIFIEWRPSDQGYVDSTFTAYLNNQLNLSKHISYTNEVFQIGYKLAAILKHRTLYCMDAPGLYIYDTVSSTARKFGQYEQYIKYYNKRNSEVIREDSLWRIRPLKERLLHINTHEELLKSHYLNAGLTTAPYVGPVGNYAGAEFMSEWYKRNFRMFSNIVKQIEQNDQNLLIIVGAGHAHILKQLFADSQQFEVIEVNQYLN